MHGCLFKRTGVVLVAGIGLSLGSVAQSATIRVDPSSQTNGPGDALDWSNAYHTLTGAIGPAGAGDEIRVANGAYKPTTGTDRSATFLMERFTIKGGYAGYGAADPDARDPVAYPTILSGNINNQSSTADNSHHVVTFSDSGMIDTNTRLDGVTITAGNADGMTAP